MKTCKGCFETLPVESFYAHPMMADGRLGFCKPCVRERVRKHRAENESVREYDRVRYYNNPQRRTAVTKWIVEHPELVRLAGRAHQAVYTAVRKGRLVRPVQCEECSVECKPEAAHHDYSRRLDVRWLCARCHRKWDSREPKLRRVS